MIVAVVGVRVVKVSGNEVIDVIAVRDSFVSATRPLTMAFLVIPAIVSRSAIDSHHVTDHESAVFQLR